MKILDASPKNRTVRGQTLVELLVAVSALATVAALAYAVVAATMPASQESKLERQVSILNASASMYIVSGGYIDPTLSTTEVFKKLQTSSTKSDAERTVGATGAMVAPHLVAVLTDDAETADTSLPRVLWHTGAQRFHLSYKPVVGIKNFQRLTTDADLLAVAEESRHRGGAVSYSSVDDWVWDYDDVLLTQVGPDQFGHQGGGYGGPGTPPTPDSGLLSPPLISVPDGVYPITDFAIGVTLANPNPTGSSTVYYSVSGGPVKQYNDEVLELGPGQFVAARCEPITEAWKQSIFSVNHYDASPVQLAPPIIRASAPGFDWDVNKTIDVSLDNPNDHRVSKLQYRIGGGAWTDDDGRRKRLKKDSFPDGITVEARAVATAEYYHDSAIAARDLAAANAVRLDPPLITFSDPAFTDDVKKIKVTIKNPNPVGSSEIVYAVTEPERVRDESKDLRHKKYKKKFTEKRKDWEHGFAVVAYCQARHAGFEDSVPAEEETRNADAPDPEDPPIAPAGGYFDLDTSSFIAKFYDGTTDAHVHEYGKKFNVPGADFFDLKGGKLHNITEDVPEDAKFKLIIINPDLSPGGRLVINKTYDDTKPATWIPVQDYANIPIEDLPVFSFDGDDGTTRLRDLGIYFHVDAADDGLIFPTNTKEVRSNVPGSNGEWRNGALTIQAVRVDDDGDDKFSTAVRLTSGGVHGAATSGLYWESTIFWNWEGPSYTPLFTGRASGTFFSPTGQDDMVTNLKGGKRSNYFEWGDPSKGFSKGSNITFTGKGFSDVAVGELFELGTMKFQNNTIYNGTDAFTVQFDLGLDLDVPDLSESLAFSFDLFSTPNSSKNTDDENADYFTFGNFSSNFTATLDGQLYGLSLQFGEVKNNGFSNIREFHTHEGKTAQGSLFGSFYVVDTSDLADQLIP